jgi:ATP-dependent Clp protease ATP-binding subunit ClpA
MIFNRFARSARSCVESAVEEARSLGHDSIGDEDLLLGVVESNDGNAAEALLSLGVTLDAAREQADRLFADALASVGISLDEIRRQAGEAFEMRSPASGRLPFSPSAKKALEQALREAIRLRDNKITAEHVLLGILRNEHGQAVRLLAGMDIPPREVEERLDQLRSRPPLR